MEPQLLTNGKDLKLELQPGLHTLHHHQNGTLLLILIHLSILGLQDTLTSLHLNGQPQAMKNPLQEQSVELATG